MKSEMTSTSSTVATIPEGTNVTYISTHGATGSWFKISYNGKVGYVPQKYFSSLSEEVIATNSKFIAEVNVNLRSSMTTTSPILYTIQKGEVVTYLSTHGATGSWFKISYNGKVGYVAQKYFSPFQEVNTSIQENPTHLVTESTPLYDWITTSSRVQMIIPKGAKITLHSQHGATGSWAKISYNNLSGYVAMRNLQTLIVSEPKTMYVNKQTTLYDSISSYKNEIITVPIGTSVSQVSTHGATGSWSKITFGSDTGYIPTRDLSDEGTQMITPYYAKRLTTMYTSMASSKVAVQSIPADAKVDQFSIHGETGSWFQIRYDNKTGFVAARDFSPTAPSSSSERYDTERQVRIEVDGGGPLNVRSTPEILTTNKVGSLDTGTLVNVKPIIGSAWGLLTSGTYAGNYIHLGYTVTVPTTPPATEITKVVNYTSYPMTVQAMADRQEAEFAQTDFHLYDPAYLPRAWVSVSGETGTIVKPELKVVSGLGTALKMSASSSAATLITVPSGGTVSYVSRSGSWYKVKYGTMTGYVTFSSVMGTAEILSKPLLSSHVYGLINPGEQVKITGQDGNYYTVYYKRPAGYSRQIYDYQWRLASPEEILTYVDPSRIDPNSRSFYQFLDLSKSAGTTATILNKMLTSKGSLSGLGQAFVDAGKQYGINEVYLLSHALHETGNGTSLLASGVPVDKDGNALINIYGNRIYPEREVAATVYNMYGIQAVDSDPLGQGAKYAFQQGWFSPKQAVIGGAYWIGASYINHSTYKQNTLYKMRFNPAAPGTHQYATNIAWAALQTKQIYDVYQLLDAYTLHFDVPKYQ